jgi:hypothetical protein
MEPTWSQGADPFAPVVDQSQVLGGDPGSGELFIAGGAGVEPFCNCAIWRCTLKSVNGTCSVNFDHKPVSKYEPTAPNPAPHCPAHQHHDRLRNAVVALRGCRPQGFVLNSWTTRIGWSLVRKL